MLRKANKIKGMKFVEYKSLSNFFRTAIPPKPFKHERLCSKADFNITNLHSLYLGRITGKHRLASAKPWLGKKSPINNINYSQWVKI